MPDPSFKNAATDFRQGLYGKAQAEFQSISTDSGATPRMRQLASIFAKICDLRSGGAIGSPDSLSGPTDGSMTLADSRAFLKKTIRVGLVAPQDSTKGIFRDIETTHWALSKDPAFEVSVCKVHASLAKVDFSTAPNRIFKFASAPHADYSNTGRSFADWLESLDLVFVPESLNLSLLEMVGASTKAKRVLLLPNIDWAILGGGRDDVSEFIDAAKANRSNLTILSRTKATLRAFKNYNLESIYIPWSIPDPVLSRSDSGSSGRASTVLFNGGNLGYRNRRGLDIVLDALADPVLRDIDFKAVIKVVKFPTSLESRLKQAQCDVELLTGFLERDHLYALYKAADITLYPSRFEGFGMGLLEALHAGSYPLATDGPPMNEIALGRDMCVAAVRTGQMRLAEIFEVNPATLAESLRAALAADARLTRAQSNILRQRQALFPKQLASICRFLT